ncbi:MAG: OadG family protein [Clostridiales Family XIII bacterium]|jgi:hypothetical protein|nr:OadG family protein [Clostridiales Family XIII bacterium]
MTLSVWEGVLSSLFVMFVVFVVLIVLWALIRVFSVAVSAIEKSNEKKRLL